MFADYAEADRGEFVTYLFREVPGKPSIEDLKQPILEAVQVLEHAELIYLNYVSDLDTRRWSATRLGLQMLDDGKSAIRQRIKDRIGA